MSRFSARNLLCVMLVVLVVVIGLCWWLHEPAAPRAHVYVKGTPAYETRIASFKYPPDDARVIAEKHLKAMQSPPFELGLHSIVVGDEYVFSSYEAKAGVALDGLYVNGNSGEVVVRRSPAVARP